MRSASFGAALVVTLLTFGCSEDVHESTPMDSGAIDASSRDVAAIDESLPDGEPEDASSIDACRGITDPVMHAAFETYVARLLREIREFSDLAYILVFTEDSEPCGTANASSAVEVAVTDVRSGLASPPYDLTLPPR